MFSLGVVLWECLAARRLFLRDNELATLRAVVYEPIPAELEIVAQTSEGEIMALKHRQHPTYGVQFHPDQQGIDHLVLGLPGVDVAAADRELRAGGVEGFKLQPADRPSVAARILRGWRRGTIRA